MCDNASVTTSLRNKGVTRSQQMCQVAINTCKWAEKRSMTLTPRHLPGHFNMLADHLSHRDHILKSELSLYPAVARRVFRVWSSPQVDLFALKCTAKLATYISDSQIGGLESRQFSIIIGRYVCLCIPTNNSDQADSEQVNLALRRTDPHSPPLAKTGMVPGPPASVNILFRCFYHQQQSC